MIAQRSCQSVCSTVDTNATRLSRGSCLHAADDVDGLRPQAVARLLQVNDGHRQVHVAAPLAKRRVTEHFQVWREEILRQKYTRAQYVIHLNTTMAHMWFGLYQYR